MVGAPSVDNAPGAPGASFVAALDGSFYYWIGSTSWSAIPPLDRVWFATEEAAQQAGFRRAPSAWEPLDEFEILGELGRGGTSIVYHGRDLALGRDVAIKVVQAQFGTDPETGARFVQEARLLAALRHPNIVSAFAVKPLQGGGFALVMEYVRGRTLRDVINQEGALPSERVERILKEVGGALEAAHALGVVHRDVKPDNIFIEDGSGRTLLADFGIAVNLDNPSGLTLVGSTIGTPNYMSPEQIDGARLDGRSDLYSLALIGWEMLTGEKPWHGESLYSVIYKQKHEDLPTLRRVRTDIPPRLAFAIEGALAKDPDARWASAAQFLSQLSDESWRARWRRLSPPVLWKHRAKPQPVPKKAARRAPVESAKTVFFRQPHEEAPTSAPAGARGRTWPRTLLRGSAVAALVVIALGVHAMRVGEPLASTTEAAAPRSNVGSASAPGAGAPFATATSAGSEMAFVVPVDSTASGELDPQVALAPPPDEDEPLEITPTDLTRALNQGTLLATLPGSLSSGTAPPPAPVAAATSSVPPSTGPSAGTTWLPVARADSKIAAGGLHTCEVDASRMVVCWGGNDRGQLGSRGQGRATAGVEVVAASGAQAVEAGGFHTCALRALGSAVCWGENSDGQLGGGSAGEGGVVSIPGRRFYSLSLGSAHTCGLGTDDVAYCWGSNASGQLGDGTFTSHASPTRVLLASALASVTVGWSHSCALTRQGRVLCWGDNAAGQLGDGTTSARSTPTLVQGDAVFRTVAAGSAHTCALTVAGAVLCWGQNSAGQLGDGSTANKAVPTAVAGGLQLVAVSAGGRHSCGIDPSGAAWCWGQNNYGQLGTGSLEPRSVPTRVSSDVRFASIRSSGSHTCAVATDGDRYCWGYNVEGQVGDGTQIHRTLPQRVAR